METCIGVWLFTLTSKLLAFQYTRLTRLTMSRYADDQYSTSGSGDSLLLILSWFGVLFAFNWITGVLRFPYRLTVFLWACLNFLPVIWLSFQGSPEILPILGLLVVAGFSYVMGKSVFEERERDRKRGGSKS